MNAALVLVLGPFALASACVKTAAKSPAAASEPATFSEQAKRGADLYTAHCSSCHGKGGEGTAQAPAVVGATALPLNPPSGAKLRQSQFVTVADVAAFVAKNMPGDAPGSLTADEYYSVLAFDLKANGIVLDDKLDAALAARLKIPRN